MDADIACSMSLTSLLTNAWRSVSPASSKQSMSSTFCPTCSSCAAFPVTSGRTTDRSSSPRLSKLGSRLSAPRLPISNGAVLGRTATSRASTLAFAMSCSTARFSTLYARPRSSSRVGDATTTRSGPTPQSDTSHQHQRCSCPHSPRGRLRYAERLRRPLAVLLRCEVCKYRDCDCAFLFAWQAAERGQRASPARPGRQGRRAKPVLLGHRDRLARLALRLRAVEARCG